MSAASARPQSAPAIALFRLQPANTGPFSARQLVNSLAYPMDLLGRSLLIVLFMWIFMNLWRVTYGSAGRPLHRRPNALRTQCGT